MKLRCWSVLCIMYVLVDVVLCQSGIHTPLNQPTSNLPTTSASATVTLDMPVVRTGVVSSAVDQIAPVQVQDFIEITNIAETVRTQKFSVFIEYRVQQPATLRLHCYGRDTLSHILPIADIFVHVPATIDPQEKRFLLRIPDELVYFDIQNKVPTYYYSRNIELSASLLANYGMPGLEPSILVSDKRESMLVSPWYRPHLPVYCLSWDSHLHDVVKWKKLPQCSSIQDQQQLISNPVALSNTDIGFTKKLHSLKWPTYVPEHVRRRFETPKRLLERRWCNQRIVRVDFGDNQRWCYDSGNLHIQLHTNSGSGTAFLTNNFMPLRKWIHVMLRIDGEKVDLYTFTEDAVEQIRHYSYVFPNALDFNETEGLWVIGGFQGSTSIDGFIADVRVYRHATLSISMYSRYASEDRDRLRKFGLTKLAEVCRSWKYHIHYKVLKRPWNRGYCFLYDRLVNQMHSGICFKDAAPDPIRDVDDLRLLRKLRKLYTETPELHADLYSRQIIGKRLYADTVHMLMKQSHFGQVELKMLTIAGCLGNHDALHVAATLNTYGFGMQANISRANILHLYGAHLNSALSQAALAYRHKIGWHGFSQDEAIATGYMRHVALASKKILEEESHDVLAQTEMVRLDQAHDFRSVRGKESDLFNWLSQQAKMGSADAQTKMAEMLFHGKQGVDVDRQQALEFYEQGARAGDPNAMYNTGVLYLKGNKDLEKNETKAIEWFERAAALNSTLAFNSLGYIELVLRYNQSGAEYYWSRAVEVGDKEGIFNYGTLVEAGLVGKKPNKTGAYHYFLRAAEKGQRNACVKVAEYMIAGEATSRNVKSALQYLQFVAEQLNQLGLYMRTAIDSYLEGNWYKSLLHHLFAAEAGLELAGFNIALLSQEFQEEVGSLLNVSSPIYFYNMTAQLGWSLSLIQLGHFYWYGEHVDQDYTQASLSYAKAIERNSPEGLFNLGYMVENGYPLQAGISFAGQTKYSKTSHNLTLAKFLYETCVNSEADEREGSAPCYLALMNVKWKIILSQHPYIPYMLSVGLVTFLGLLLFCRDDHH